MGELNLIVLHMLRELASRPTVCMVTLLPMRALAASIEECLRPSNTLSAAATASASSSVFASTAAASSSSPAAAARRRFQPLRFTTPVPESGALRPPSVFIRVASSVLDLPPSAHAVYCPSLMWFGHLASLAKLNAAMEQQLIHPLQARLFPPISWDELIQSKDKIYTVFHSYMLPTKWVPTAGKCTNQVVAELLRGVSDGHYRVKGSCSCCGRCSATITVQSGRSEELEAEVARFILKSFQPSIGIQPLLASFPSNELRFWTVAEDGAAAVAAAAAPTIHPSEQHQARFHKTGLLLKTSALLVRANDNGIPFQAEMYTAVHADSLACSKLIDRMLLEQASFFERIYQLGVRSLRFDMGYNADTKTAFFNEFATAPDGNSPPARTRSDLAHRHATHRRNDARRCTETLNTPPFSLLLPFTATLKMEIRIDIRPSQVAATQKLCLII